MRRAVKSHGYHEELSLSQQGPKEYYNPYYFKMSILRVAEKSGVVKL